MREVHGNLWNFAEYGFADVVVVTTNGSINRFGSAVMGRGCALQAKQRFPGIERLLAHYLRSYGNRPFVLKKADCPPTSYSLVSMPVKHHWRDLADLDLIEQSANALVLMANKRAWQSIVLPRAGCGNGGLHWQHVQPLLAAIFDDRFTVVTYRA
jgi:hypothetical protein